MQCVPPKRAATTCASQTGPAMPLCMHFAVGMRQRDMMPRAPHSSDQIRLDQIQNTSTDGDQRDQPERVFHFRFWHLLYFCCFLLLNMAPCLACGIPIIIIFICIGSALVCSMLIVYMIQRHQSARVAAVQKSTAPPPPPYHEGPESVPPYETMLI